jgi:hypothetical protein
MNVRLLIVLVVVGMVGASASAQVTPDRLVRAEREPHNWLTYSAATPVNATACSIGSRGTTSSG